MAADAETLAARLGAWLGGRLVGASQVRVQTLTPSRGGFSNETRFAQARYRHGAAEREIDLVMRLPPQGEALFPSYDLARQYRCMQALGEAGMAVPRLIGYEADATLFGAPFYVMERVSGDVPSEDPLYSVEGWLHDAAPADQLRHWNAGLEFLAQIARLDPAPFEFLGFSGSIAGQIAQYSEFLGWIEAHGQPYTHLKGALRWLESHRPRTEEPTALCWGDAKLGNCIFRHGELAVALDWEAAELGDPVGDLAWWLIHDRALSEGYGVPRLPGFPSRAESVSTWMRASRRSPRNLEYLEVLCAWKFSVIMARIGSLYLHRGSWPESQRFDIRNGASTILATLGSQYGFH